MSDATTADVLANRARWACETSSALPWLRSLPSASVHCWVTSPPYYGLRSYLPKDHPDKGLEIGTEKTPGEYAAKLVEVFAEAMRVLHPSGTLWLNVGDSYANDRKGPRGAGLKKKDLIGVPWMLAFALREAGWYLRMDNVWAKGVSYAPSLEDMLRRNVARAAGREGIDRATARRIAGAVGNPVGNPMPDSSQDRATKAHETVFLLAKSPRYFYDVVATQERAAGDSPGNKTHKGKTAYESGDETMRTKVGLTEMVASETRNRRSVWFVPVGRFKGAHFAVMPEAIVRPCVRAGTSEKGCCPKCLAPWVRVVRRERVATRTGAETKTTGDRMTDGRRDPLRRVTRTETVGWKPSCDCPAADPIPCVVGDPFAGAGTVLKVATELGRRAVGADLDPKCLGLIRGRIPA